MIADLSINHVERQVLLCGWLVQRPAKDYGIDLELLTFNPRGEPEPERVYLQVKATDRLPALKRSDEIGVQVERGDLEFWLRLDGPFILIVYDARRDVAHWLYVQAYFQNLVGFDLAGAPARITVRIPRTNVLSPAAVRRFATFRDRVLRQRGSIRHADH